MSVTPSKVGSRVFLILAAILTVVLWQFRWGHQLLYPFTLLATYAHEMGHGLTALLMGASFQELHMFPDGSGRALYHGDLGRLTRAFVAAGGLVGPSIAGALLLVASRAAKRSRVLLQILGVLMLITAVIFARSWFALLFIGVTGVVLVGAGRLLPAVGASFLLQLIGVQLCVAIFRDVDYMFSPGALVGGVQQLSDSAAIADALVGPYWFWGGLTALFSALVLVGGLYVALRGGGAPKPNKRAPAEPAAT